MDAGDTLNDAVAAFPDPTSVLDDVYMDHENVPVPPVAVEVSVIELPEVMEPEDGWTDMDGGVSTVTDILFDCAVADGVAPLLTPESVKRT